jgi:hypothetical protein
MTRLPARPAGTAATPPHKPADNDDDHPPRIPVPQRMPVPVPVNDPHQPDHWLLHA